MIKTVLILSDSHGNDRNILVAIEQTVPDLLIHLGDIQSDPDCILEDLEKVYIRHHSYPDSKPKAVFIKGNCDRLYREKMHKNSLILGINNKKVLLTHGHTMNVDFGIDELLAMATKLGCDMAMYGHTHGVYDRIHDSVHILNPGSISFPRYGERRSYMIMRFADEDSYSIELKYL